MSADLISLSPWATEPAKSLGTPGPPQPTPELQDTIACYFLWCCVQHFPFLHKATLHALHSNLVCEGCTAACLRGRLLLLISPNALHFRCFRILPLRTPFLM